MIKKIIYTTLILCSFIVNAQNFVTFSPTSQAVSGDSGETITATVRASGFGNKPDAIFFNVFTEDIDSGFIDLGYHGIMDVGDNETVTFRFKKNVTTTTSKTYKFRTEYASDAGNIDGSDITISVIFNAAAETNCNLGAPSSPHTENITETSAKLDWSDVSGNDDYQYSYRKSGTTSWTNSTVPNSFVNKINLASNTTYQWRVRAKCSNGKFGDWTSIKSFTTLSGCANSITITNTINSGATNNQSAKITITATNTINSGARANYDAGTTVYLKPNFKAKSGATFRAFIEGCASSASKNLNAQEDITEVLKTPEAIVKVSEKQEAIVAEFSFDKSFTVYPNPTNGLFKVQGSSKFTSYSIQNISGGQIMSNEVDESQLNIDISKFTTGIYFLELQTEDGEVFRKKVIKN